MGKETEQGIKRLVSIIIPVYNVEAVLRRCIDSIFNQSFLYFELLLINDGSSDSSGRICDEYAKSDSRVRVIHKENAGPSSARNLGIQAAAGKYIMFCDSDDYVHPLWCETMLNTIVKHPRAMVVSDVFRVEDGIVKEDARRNTGEIEVEESYFSLYKKGISAYTVNKIYDADIIRKNRLMFMEDCRFSEDAAFNAEYCRYCEEIVYIRKQLYYYVQNTESLMNRYHADLFSLHFLPFWCRLPLIKEKELGEYCDIWLYQFQHLFGNVFDARNSMTFLQKLQYNHRMMNTKEFRYCLEHAAGKNENSLSLRILKTHNYYLCWIFNKLVQFKQRIKSKK
ncbi:MAG: glycosyltransferase family 2 protein [Clostridiales bacterium]|nr:glycosyltransferase family 2 protein [Clostridiales bacterium]MBE5798404.1 glycosyltransferase family 2 protein [Clostridiales bacterium]